MKVVFKKLNKLENEKLYVDFGLYKKEVTSKEIEFDNTDCWDIDDICVISTRESIRLKAMVENNLVATEGSLDPKKCLDSNKISLYKKNKKFSEKLKTFGYGETLYVKGPNIQELFEFIDSKTDSKIYIDENSEMDLEKLDFSKLNNITILWTQPIFWNQNIKNISIKADKVIFFSHIVLYNSEITELYCSDITINNSEVVFLNYYRSLAKLVDESFGDEEVEEYINKFPYVKDYSISNWIVINNEMEANKYKIEDDIVVRFYTYFESEYVKARMPKYNYVFTDFDVWEADINAIIGYEDTLETEIYSKGTQNDYIEHNYLKWATYYYPMDRNCTFIVDNSKIIDLQIQNNATFVNLTFSNSKIEGATENIYNIIRYNTDYVYQEQTIVFNNVEFESESLKIKHAEKKQIMYLLSLDTYLYPSATCIEPGKSNIFDGGSFFFDGSLDNANISLKAINFEIDAGPMGNNDVSHWTYADYENDLKNIHYTKDNRYTEFTYSGEENTGPDKTFQVRIEYQVYFNSEFSADIKLFPYIRISGTERTEPIFFRDLVTRECY